MVPLTSRVNVICGHYGTGKTNLSINLAIECARSGESVTLIDLDVVNPYFRSADYSDVLTKEGVKVIGPNFANTNLDTPSLPGAISGAIEMGERVIIDVGGDDAGATALGVYSRQVNESKPDVIYVINRYRSLTTTPAEAVEILREIESAARIRATGIINNSHLKSQTDARTVTDSIPFAEEVARMTGLPLMFSTAPRDVLSLNNIEGIHPIDVYVRTPWE
ncbi:MAG: hypothetical protein IK043_03905 [Candidatus Methanomethylophilaceae archaeon]|nr:hypothetical protein [Candidatus Methanomethylophilaceae archaeon]